MKKITFFIFLYILLTSCSSDNSNSDFIVGKWKVTQIKIDGDIIELSECNQVLVYEFKSDFSMRSYIDGQQNNVICGIYDFGFYKWEKITDTHFRSNHLGSNSLQGDYYKENNKLKVVFNSENEAYYTRIH